MSFFVRIYVYIHANQTVTYTGQKFSEQNFRKVVQPNFEIPPSPLICKIFEQNFHQYLAVYLVQIWTHKNADEKPGSFSWRSKNVKKRAKMDTV